ncbi:MAG: hypothetical protein GY875_03135 [Gammaproteobacteria bacterium]|nr:hypothetical protein [Gammaproteobacteria bacterium]
MARSERLRQHLPYLYRPESDSESLLNHFLDALGFSMDQAQQLMTQIMQSHWYAYADKASFDEHALRDRERRGMPPYNVRDASDQLEIALYPYIEDLARHGKLVAIPPWQEPLNQKDLVENYRRRLARIIKVYRNGLGTLDALRSMVEAELPWALENSLPERIRSFAIEEGISVDETTVPVVMDGLPAEKVGALMRWQTSRGDALATKPTLLIHGIEALADETETTEMPLIERYSPGDDGLIGIGVAYDNTLAAGQTLRLQPARRSWLGTAGGLRESPLTDAGNSELDPSANGPWGESTGSPAINIDRLYRSACGSLWLSGEQQLWTHNGTDFTRILDGETFTDIHCLFEVNRRLYIGCADGLFTTDLYRADGSYTRAEVSALSGVAVYQFFEHDSEFWLATENGPCRMHVASDQSVTLDPVLVEIPTYSLLFREQSRYFGCELGLLRFDQADGRWHAYRGETEDEPQLQWMLVDPTSLPAANDMALPPVRSIALTPDQSLWFGSAEGLCRYYAFHERDLLYRAQLEAYPDMMSGAVQQLLTDDRGMLWIVSSRGLFRYDGRDLSQYRLAEAHWQQMGRADSTYPNELAAERRGQWRYNRIDGQWEQYQTGTGRWSDSSLVLRSLEEDAISGVLITDSLRAHLGSWDGSAFSAESEVPPAQIVMRCKPDHETIVTGGPPFIPTLPKAISTWRYLQLESEAVTLPPPGDLPWWSREGRLFPPPDMQDVYPGRYRSDEFAIDGRFDESIFAYLPSAMITMTYSNPLAMAVCIRLFKRTQQDAIDPAIVERVLTGISHVRPAGVPVTLAVEGKIIKGATL